MDCEVGQLGIWIVSSFFTKEFESQRALTGEGDQTFKKEIISIPDKLLQKTALKPALSRYQSQTKTLQETYSPIYHHEY